jgi:hypothetical protein
MTGSDCARDARGIFNLESIGLQSVRGGGKAGWIWDQGLTVICQLDALPDTIERHLVGIRVEPVDIATVG